MKVHLISIGNSKGIRIPASVIKECGLGDELEMRVENKAVILTPARRTRDGWDQAFNSMHKAGDDDALWPDDMQADFDDKEWTW